MISPNIHKHTAFSSEFIVLSLLLFIQFCVPSIPFQYNVFGNYANLCTFPGVSLLGQGGGPYRQTPINLPEVIAGIRPPIKPADIFFSEPRTISFFKEPAPSHVFSFRRRYPNKPHLPLILFRVPYNNHTKIPVELSYTASPDFW